MKNFQDKLSKTRNEEEVRKKENKTENGAFFVYLKLRCVKEIGEEKGEFGVEV